MGTGVNRPEKTEKMKKGVARLDVLLVEGSNAVKFSELEGKPVGQRHGMRQRTEIPYIEFQLDVTLEQSFLGAHSDGRAKNFSRGGQVELPDLKSRIH
jgi:hypothetical protein